MEMGSEAVRLTNVDIDNALDNNHFQVIFQPVFHLKDGALMRVESFVRWTHPGLGVLPPGAFISFFESQGRMGELTRHVISTALDAYVSWRGTEKPGFSVNLAQADLTDPEFGKWLTALLKKKKFPANLVTLECPAVPATMKLAEASRHFSRLRKTDARLAIEVRGRANDLLRNIDPFPFDELKTGGSAILRFARTMRGGPGLTAISELLDLARANDADIIAVGVEDQASLKALAGLGFTAAQGNYLAAIGDLFALEPQVVNKVRRVLELPEASESTLKQLMSGHRQDIKPAGLGKAAARKPAAAASRKAPSGKTAQEDNTGTSSSGQAGRLTPEKIALLKKKQAQMAAKRRAERKAEEAAAEAEETIAGPEAEKALKEAVDRKRADENARKLQSRLSQAYEYQLPGSTATEEDGQAGLLLGGALSGKTQTPRKKVEEPEISPPVEENAAGIEASAPPPAEKPVADEKPEAVAKPEPEEPETVPEPTSESAPELAEETAATAQEEPAAEAGSQPAQEEPSSEAVENGIPDAPEPDASAESPAETPEKPKETTSLPHFRSTFMTSLHLTSIADIKPEDPPLSEAGKTEKADPVDEVTEDIASEPTIQRSEEEESGEVEMELPLEARPEDFRSEDEVLDEAFEGATMLDPSASHEDEDDDGHVELDSTERMIAGKLALPRRRSRKNFLMRKYRIMPTHFWPRSWKRKWRALHASQPDDIDYSEAASEQPAASETENTTGS